MSQSMWFVGFVCESQDKRSMVKIVQSNMFFVCVFCFHLNFFSLDKCKTSIQPKHEIQLKSLNHPSFKGVEKLLGK